MYKNILFAVQDTPSENLVQEIKTFTESFQAKLSLLHVIDIPREFIENDNNEKNFTDKAQKKLTITAKLLNVSLENQHVVIGNPKIAIAEFVAKHKIDLLIVRHHEREIDLIITNNHQQETIYHVVGSTTQALLSIVKCPILILPFHNDLQK